MKKIYSMDKTTFNKILEELNKQIINSFEKNKKLMVCFAGIPGSGKTFLAKKIEEEFKGVRISNDNLRKIVEKNIIKDEKQRDELVREFVFELLKGWPFKNELIILDSGIERKYEDTKKIANEKHWKMFIIKMVVPKDVIIERIKKKDKERFEKRPEDIKRWFIEFENFNKKVKADFVFKCNFDLDNLFKKIRNL